MSSFEFSDLYHLPNDITTSHAQIGELPPDPIIIVDNAEPDSINADVHLLFDPLALASGLGKAPGQHRLSGEEQHPLHPVEEGDPGELAVADLEHVALVGSQGVLSLAALDSIDAPY